MTRHYKWMADGNPVYGTGTYATPGEWQPRIEGELKSGLRGYHILTAEQVPLWCGTELIEVEALDVEIAQEDKCVCRTWREVKRYSWTRDDMVAYAKWCAGRAGYSARYAAAAAADARHVADCADCARCSTAPAARRAVSVAAVARFADATAERIRQRRWIEKRIGEKLG